MRKKFTMLLASLFLMTGVAKADFVQEYTKTGAFWTAAGTVYPEGLNNTTDAGGGKGNASQHIGVNGHSVYKAEVDVIADGGNITVTFAYVSTQGLGTNQHAASFLGVDVLKDGEVVYHDYHLSFVGGSPQSNVYTLTDVEAGNYTLRYFICSKAGDHDITNTGGTITVTGAIQSGLVDLTINYTINGVVKSTTEVEKVSGESYAISAPTYTKIAACNIGETAQTVTNGACTITVPAEAATITVELANNFPFETSTDYENAVWYVLQIRSNNKKYVVRSTSAPYANTTTTPTTEDALWAFVGNPFDGIQVLNKAAGAGQTLGLDNSNNGVMTENGKTWNITQGNGGFLLRDGNEGNRYIHDYSSTLKIWANNDAAGDAGSAFVVTSEAEMISLATTALNAQKALMPIYEEASYYTYSDEALAAANTTLQGVATPTTILAALQAKATAESVQAALDAAGKGTAGPAVGDFIQLKNRQHNKYLKGFDSDASGVDSKADLATIWEVVDGTDGNVKLKNQQTGKYIGQIRQSATVAMTDEADAAQFSLTNQDKVYAVFKDVTGGDYAYGHVNGGKLVGWEKSSYSTQWLVSNVCPLSITYRYNGAEVSTSSTIVEKGSVYTVTSPVDFTKPGACKKGEEALEAVDGVFSFEVTGTTTLTVELTDDLPFVTTTLNEDGSFPENTTWYVVKQHSSNGYAWAWKYDETNGITAHATTDYTDNHLWCFAGSKDDLKIYNKVAGKGFSLTNTDPASMAAENAAVWKMVKSNNEDSFAGKNPFCLQNGSGNSYLNAQNDNGINKLKYWTSKDQGSTIMVIAQSAIELTTLVNRLNGTINTMMENAGKGIGYYESAEDVAKLKNAIDKAQALLDSNNGKPEDFVAAIAELNEAETKAAKIAMPEAGKYYRIGYDFGSEVGVKYMESVNSNVANKATALNMTSDADGISTVFYYADDKLQSSDKKKYLKEVDNTRGLHDDAGKITFSVGSGLGKVKIQATAYLHANKSGDTYFVDHCGGDGCTQHNFIVKEVTAEELNGLNESYLEDCSYITTLAENSNHPVIVNNARSNWAVADQAVALNTLAKLGLAKAVFDTKQQFAFITPDEGKNFYLYSVHAKRYLKSNNTLGAQGEPIEFIDASSKGENKVQVRFKDVDNSYINVGGSKQITIDWWSTIDEGNACELVQCNTLTFDLDEALDIFNNGADITLTYKLGDKQVSTTTYKTKGETYSFSNPYAYTTVTSCTKNGDALTATDGTYSFEIIGDANIVVELESNLPFTLSESYENAVWYRLKIRPNNDNGNTPKWVVRKAEKPYDNVTTAPTDNNGLWAFVGNAIDGVQVLNKEAGANQTLGFDNMNNQTPVYMKEGATSWTLGKLAKDGYEGFLLRQGTTGNKYLHDFGGQLKFWDASGAPTDLGSAFVAEAPLSITYLYKGEELAEQKVDTYVNYGTTYTIANPFANKYLAISECVAATGTQPVNADGAWTVKVTEPTSITVTLVEDLPFKTSTDVYSAVWHYMQMNSSSWKYMQKNENDNNTSSVNVNSLTDRALWAFVGDALNGFKILNKGAGGAALTVDATADGTVAYMNASGDQKWNVEKGNGGFILRQGTNECLNDYAGGGVMKIWNHTNSPTGAGSAFRTIECGVRSLEELALNLRYIDVYTIQAERSPLMYSATETTKLSSGLLDGIAADENDVNQQFLILRTPSTPEGYFYLYSLGAEKFVDEALNFIDFPSPVFSLEASNHIVYPWRVKIADKYVIPGTGGTDGNKLHHTTEGDDDDGKRYRIVKVGQSNNHYALISKIEEAEDMIKLASELSHDKVYTVSTLDEGYWYYNSEKDALWSTEKAGVEPSSQDINQQFAFLTVAEHTYIYSMGAEKFVIMGEPVEENGYTHTYTVYSDVPSQAIELLDAQGSRFYPFVAAFVNGNERHHIGISNGYEPPVITFWNDLNDHGNKIKLREVTSGYMPINAAELLAAAMTKIDAYLAAGELKPELEAVIAQAQALLDKNYLDTEDATLLTDAKMTAQAVCNEPTSGSEALTEQINLLTAAISAVTYVTEVADFKNCYVYTFVTKRGWVGADENSANLIGTVNSKVDPAPTPSADNEMFQWAVYKSTRNHYYMYNIGKGMFMTGTPSGEPIPFVATPTGQNLAFKRHENAGWADYPIMLSPDNKGAVSQNQNAGLFYWSNGWNTTNDDGSNHKVTVVGKVADATLATIKAAVELYEARVIAIAELDAAIAEAQVKVNAKGDAPGYYSSEMENVETSFEGIKTFRENIDSQSLEDINAKVEEAEAISASFKFNMPKADKFYVLKCNHENRYIYTKVDNKLYWSGDNLSGDYRAVWQFEAGDAEGTFKMKNVHNGSYIPSIGGAHVSMTDAGADVIIAPSPAVNGAVIFSTSEGGNGLHAHGGANTVIGYGNNAGANHYFFEEVTTFSYNVTVGTAGYSTLYLNYATVVPEIEGDGNGVFVASAIGEDNVSLVPVKAGDVLPAKTGVIIKADADTDCEFAYTSEVGTVTSMLKGSLYNEIITPEANTTCYVLAKPAAQEGEEENPVGLYKATLNRDAAGNKVTGDGVAFLNNANKIYLSVPGTQGARALTFRFGRGGDEGTTEIDNSQLTIDNSQLIIYDLTGRRIPEIVEKGIYIVNGKKVVIR